MDNVSRNHLRAWIPWMIIAGSGGVLALLVALGRAGAPPERAPSARPSAPVAPASPPASSKVTTQTPTPSISPQGEAFLRQGVTALQQSRLPDAEHAFSKAVHSDPGSALARDYLGIAYLQQRRFPEALHQFQEEARLAPASAYGWARVADVRYAQGSPKAAIQALEKAAAISPNEAQFYFNLGMLYPKVMELGKAVDALKRCVALEPENVHARYMLGNLLFKLTRLDEAEPALQEAVRLAPNVGTYHFGLAEVYLKREATPENTARAQAELIRALELGVPEAAAAHYDLGQCYQRQEKWEEARRELETSVKMAPEAWTAYYALQEVLQRLGRTEDARRAMARFRTLRARADARRTEDFYLQEAQRNPDSPDAYFQLAAYLAKSGDKAQARQALARARQLATGKNGTPSLQKRLRALATELEQNGGK
jgi:tetratricopeptide (TPR) repeat protein